MSEETTDNLLELVRVRDRNVRKNLQSLHKQVGVARSLGAGRIQRFEFADRPLNLGHFEIAIITDGRDIGETAGNGTGVLALYKPAANVWYRMDNTAVVV